MHLLNSTATITRGCRKFREQKLAAALKHACVRIGDRCKGNFREQELVAPLKP